MTMNLVKEVRERSGAPLGECKKALDESGDVERALELLQKRGILKAKAKSARVASNGLVVTYNHGGRVAVLLEVNTETDFVARNPEFVEFCDSVAMQIAAMNPRYVSVEDVPKEDLDKQVEIFTGQLRDEGKPEKSWAKIAAGKLGKWYSDVCLSDQESVVHPKQTVEALRIALVAKMGENVKIRRFQRWEVGEGIEKPQEDYLEEVAKLAAPRGED